MRRVTAALAALLLAPLLVAGCGSDGEDDGRAASAEARARASAPIDPADPARAAAGPLTLKDLGPEWELEGTVEEVGDTAPLTRELMTCAGAQSIPVHSSAEAEAPKFDSDELLAQLDSEVTINRTEKETIDDFAVVESKKFTDCLLEDGALDPEKVPLADGDATLTSRVVDGVGDRTVVHRVAAPFIMQGERTFDATDYAFIRVGRAYAFVLWEPTLDAPLPPRLLTIAVSRLEKAMASQG